MSNRPLDIASKSQAAITNAKIYKHLMPLLIIVYIISFIDRTNIGIARASMSIDLGLSATAYGLGAGLFFLTYSTMEIPSNLIMARVGARFWITRIMFTWGVISAGMAFVTGPTSFYVMRLLLGAAEAGLYPGIILYLTYWFGREDRARAVGMFLLGVCIANIVGAPLGGALLMLDGLGGLHGWQWMFIVEGLPAVLLAFYVYAVLPNKPRDAKWLTKTDIEYIENKLAAERPVGVDKNQKFSFKTAFTNKTFMLIVAIYFTHQISVYSLTYFLPSIINSYGKMSTLMLGLLTAIPWIAAALGGFFLPKYANTASRSRIMLVSGFMSMAVGFLIGVLGGPVLGLIGFCIGASMFFVVQSIIFTYPATLMSGPMLAGGLGLLACLGITGGFFGPYVFGLLEDRTGSPSAGLWFAIVLQTLAIIGAARVKQPAGSKDKPANQCPPAAMNSVIEK
ncbi:MULTISPECIES: MFS transporter [unclassified Serratia (in: enterobacteria)]|uniref:MFS transporter n=1 Tax=unclassified Serratia (in: enterobacteria) TaxID=2647522 RepID=UPI0018AB399E|nr:MULTISPECIES: MFS transporter [unclassified Serratia (in: enterobacteria)]